MGYHSELRMPVTDVGTPTDGYPIPCLGKVLEIVKAMHLRVPYFNLIGRDMSVDQEGTLTLVERNRFGNFLRSVMDQYLVF